MLALLWPALAAAATPIVGVEWTPFSRSDLVWVQDGRTSGVAVGEFDGTVNPALNAFGGVWFNRRLGLVGSLGVGRLTSTTWTGSDYTQRHWGVVRPEADLRIAFGPREVFRPAPWAFIGLYGDIPSARDTSTTYTPDEQQQADQNAYIERARLGGIGARAGAGVDFRLHEGIAVDALWALQYHRGVIRSDQVDTITSWLGTHVSLLLTFEWPGKKSAPPESAKQDSEN